MAEGLNEVVELQRQIDRLLAVQARQLAQWDAAKSWADDGSKSASHRLARETGLSLVDAQRLVRRARRLRTMALCTRSFLAGSLSSSRVELLVQANQPQLSTQFERDESVLLNIVETLSFRNATFAIRQWIEWAKDDHGESDAARQVEDRYLNLARSFVGVYDLQGQLPPVAGEIVANELARLEKDLFTADWAEAKAVHGDQTTLECLKRTNTQRRADALVEMARRSAGAGGRATPLVTVVMGNEAFSRTCKLASGTVITPGQVVPLLNDAQIERIVYGSPKRVIEVGHKRLFTGALRRAVQVTDGYCQDTSECDVPADDCHVDHIIPWSKGGPTIQENGQCLCDTHNVRKAANPP